MIGWEDLSIRLHDYRKVGFMNQKNSSSHETTSYIHTYGEIDSGEKRLIHYQYTGLIHCNTQLDRKMSTLLE